ncbi:2Fe-2S iron-sulfur cluster-binding protein [Roseicella aquatilis]|uniref:2Fe-2S iron-sulfur cluster binding domain-containing protein n=1 Tax=Roseicella aquatilis TaxID=2527868 RepID=A0A4R4DNL2_9PROT|nr:2Fe-2S iron-sulfur cluster-binding protein [Roseicella aquatilis]TCZ63245.1 2Fe-2S iron-sulfur cluster binding domain-containing protein [Roseicella aquatilis]
MIEVEIDGRTATVPEGTTIILAAAEAGIALTANVGCMGQGVCGACRALVRREGSREVETALACETKVEQGMRVSFLDRYTLPQQQAYGTADLADGWTIYERMLAAFPNATHCRHCSGCDRACPKGIEVQKGVELAAQGELGAAAAVFELCVMCNLCSAACPESIAPNHLGLFARRAVAASGQRPTDLIRRLHEIEAGSMAVDTTPR